MSEDLDVVLKTYAFVGRKMLWFAASKANSDFKMLEQIIQRLVLQDLPHSRILKRRADPCDSSLFLSLQQLSIRRLAQNHYYG